MDNTTKPQKEETRKTGVESTKAERQFLLKELAEVHFKMKYPDKK